MPRGLRARTSVDGHHSGRAAQKTFCSRMRRAMSWVYCDPKSRMTIVWVSTFQCGRGHAGL